MQSYCSISLWSYSSYHWSPLAKKPDRYDRSCIEMIVNDIDHIGSFPYLKKSLKVSRCLLKKKKKSTFYHGPWSPHNLALPHSDSIVHHLPCCLTISHWPRHPSCLFPHQAPPLPLTLTWCEISCLLDNAKCWLRVWHTVRDQ